MTTSTLGQVLTFFEQTNGTMSLAQIAHELDVSPARLEGMVQHWVSRGRLREVVSPDNCGTCGIKGECPFVMDLPRGYELATDDNVIPLESSDCGCGPACGAT